MSGTSPKNHLTLKACLMAGATKEEFPNWARTTTRPLDSIYGAGELNIANSYYILKGLEQPAGITAPRPPLGWDLGSLGAGTNTFYNLKVTSALAGAELSAIVVWDRLVTKQNGPGFTTTVSVPNLDLNLARHTGGTSFSVLETSASTVDNVEHTWRKALTTGTYRLQITAAAASSYAIAWRLTPPTARPQLNALKNAANLDFTTQNLVPGQSYQLQSSPDLISWTTFNTFVATASSEVLVTAWPGENQYFYRLLWTD
jgi:hypothetical protein